LVSAPGRLQSQIFRASAPHAPPCVRTKNDSQLHLHPKYHDLLVFPKHREEIELQSPLHHLQHHQPHMRHSRSRSIDLAKTERQTVLLPPTLRLRQMSSVARKFFETLTRQI